VVCEAGEFWSSGAMMLTPSGICSQKIRVFWSVQIMNR